MFSIIFVHINDVINYRPDLCWTLAVYEVTGLTWSLLSLML